MTPRLHHYLQTIQKAVCKVKADLEPQEKKNVVYQLDCDCGELYVGETGRTAGTRWKEHEADYKKACSSKTEMENLGVEWTEQKETVLKSAFKHHLDHVPDFKFGKILKSMRNEPDRMISEALFIKKAGLQGVSTILNTNSGWLIDPVFDSIIQKMPKLDIPLCRENPPSTQ